MSTVTQETSLRLIYESYPLEVNLRELAVHPPVLGTWPDRPIAVLVGEAPGATEVQTGQPFTGASGQRLTTLLGSGFRDRCGVTNILKFRPTFREGGKPELRDRRPRLQEITESLPYFWREMSLMAAPSTRIICALGRTAASALLRADIRIADFHGQWTKYPVIDPGGEAWMVFVTYHPSATLFNPELAQVLETDLFKFTEEVGMYGSQALDIFGNSR